MQLHAIAAGSQLSVWISGSGHLLVPDEIREPTLGPLPFPFTFSLQDFLLFPPPHLGIRLLPWQTRLIPPHPSSSLYLTTSSPPPSPPPSPHLSHKSLFAGSKRIFIRCKSILSQSTSLLKHMRRMRDTSQRELMGDALSFMLKGVADTRTRNFHSSADQQTNHLIYSINR